MNQKKKLLAIAVAAIAVLGLTGCATLQTEAGQVGVVQDGDLFPVDPKLLDECMKPEKSKVEFHDKLFLYPARQISWDATGEKGSERGPYTVVSSAEAPAEMSVPVVVTMDLTEDCTLLNEFHRQLGTKTNAWLNEDGSVSEGWLELLNYVVGQPTDVTLVRVAQKYTWQQIWNDDAIRLEFETALETELPKRIKDRSGDKEFFTNIQVTVYKPGPVDQKLKDAIAAEQSSIAEANAAELAAAAQEQTAIAETRVAEQEALQKQAEIRGYPSVDAYLQYLCIENGCNPFQPTYVVPQAGG